MDSSLKVRFGKNDEFALFSRGPSQSPTLPTHPRAYLRHTCARRGTPAGAAWAPWPGPPPPAPRWPRTRTLRWPGTKRRSRRTPTDARWPATTWRRRRRRRSWSRYCCSSSAAAAAITTVAARVALRRGWRLVIATRSVGDWLPCGGGGTGVAPRGRRRRWPALRRTLRGGRRNPHGHPLDQRRDGHLRVSDGATEIGWTSVSGWRFDLMYRHSRECAIIDWLRGLFFF